MSTGTDIKSAPVTAGTTVSFGARFAASDQFDAIFKEGMGLVERTATYLDGPGRKESRQLRGPVAVLYATESMRLTTRLLELASWLMIQRALKEGEISEEEARGKRARVKLRAPGRPAHVKGFTDLPGYSLGQPTTIVRSSEITSSTWVSQTRSSSRAAWR